MVQSYFKELRFWVAHYAHPELEDKRAIQDFWENEPIERHNSLRVELVAISRGAFDEQVLDEVIGKRRVARHSSYQEWAKLMLLWLSQARS